MRRSFFWPVYVYRDAFQFCFSQWWSISKSGSLAVQKSCTEITPPYICCLFLCDPPSETPVPFIKNIWTPQTHFVLCWKTGLFFHCNYTSWTYWSYRNSNRLTNISSIQSYHVISYPGNNHMPIYISTMDTIKNEQQQNPKKAMLWAKPEHQLLLVSVWIRGVTVLRNAAMAEQIHGNGPCSAISSHLHPSVCVCIQSV